MGLIVAVDQPLGPKVIGHLCRDAPVEGVKVGLPAVIRAGLSWALKVADECEGLRVLDFKLADIDYVMIKTVEPFIGHYNAFIAHSFIGAEGALLGLRKRLEEAGARLVLVASMSHPGSLEVYDRVLDRVVKVVEKVDPWGLVAPATRPRMVELLSSRFPGKVILSPGVGAQGAEPGSALCAGATYEIVGRLVLRSGDPVGEASRVKRLQDEALRRCRG